MTPLEAIPVTLLTGFLGSGKTTLLNRLLRQLPLTAVLMNEFGDVGLDHRLLEETRGPLALLSGGCVCCQIQGTLAPTLKNLWMGRQAGQVPRYERVILETSGIADPAAILDTLLRDRWIAARYRLDGILTTVDAQFGAQQLDAHFEAGRQVAVADRLLLTKTDLAESAAITELTARLTALNPAAPVLEVIQGEVDPALIFDLALFRPGEREADVRHWLAHTRYRAVRGGRAPGPSHLQRMRAFSLSFEQPLDWLGVESALQRLLGSQSRNLLRMKAILNIAGRARPLVLHGVQHVLYPPAELPAWPDEDHRSRFVFITADLDEGFVAKLLEDFAQAAATGLPTPAAAGEAL